MFLLMPKIVDKENFMDCSPGEVDLSRMVNNMVSLHCHWLSSCAHNLLGDETQLLGSLMETDDN